MLSPLRLPDDGDLYWQRWLGDLLLQTHHLPAVLGDTTFTAPAAAWIPQEWLFSLLVAASVHYHLWLAFALVIGLLPLAIFASIALRARDVAIPEATGIVIILTGMSFAASFGLRAQVLGWACCAAFLFFVERTDRRQFAAIPMTMLWANLHASVLLAPAILCARVLASAFGDRLRLGRELLLLAGVALATLCTPFGVRLPILAIELLGSPIRHYIIEWQPSRLGDAAFTLGALPLTIAIALGGPAVWRRNLAQLFVSLPLFAGAVFAARNVPLFSIAAAPLAASALSARLPQLAALELRLRGLATAAIVSVTIAIGICAVSVFAAQRSAPPHLPIAGIAAVAADGNPHRIFCENFTWCSAALAYPSLRVFMDGRCDAYPLAVWHQYVDAIVPRPEWRRTLAEYRVDAVVAAGGGRFASALAADSSWKRAYADRAYVVFRRE